MIPKYSAARIAPSRSSSYLSGSGSAQFPRRRLHHPSCGVLGERVYTSNLAIAALVTVLLALGCAAFLHVRAWYVGRKEFSLSISTFSTESCYSTIAVYAWTQIQRPSRFSERRRTPPQSILRAVLPDARQFCDTGRNFLELVVNEDKCNSFDRMDRE